MNLDEAMKAVRREYNQDAVYRHAYVDKVLAEAAANLGVPVSEVMDVPQPAYDRAIGEASNVVCEREAARKLSSAAGEDGYWREWG